MFLAGAAAAGVLATCVSLASPTTPSLGSCPVMRVNLAPVGMLAKRKGVVRSSGLPLYMSVHVLASRWDSLLASKAAWMISCTGFIGLACTDVRLPGAQVDYKRWLLLMIMLEC